MSNFKYEITEKIAVLSERRVWTKELNKVSWNDRPAKFDIRDWNHEEEENIWDKIQNDERISSEEAKKLLIDEIDE